MKLTHKLPITLSLIPLLVIGCLNTNEKPKAENELKNQTQ